jgi:sugar lactone lactonase YvrE
MQKPRMLSFVAIPTVGLVVYLLAWPTPVDPLAWTPPPPFDDPICAENEALGTARHLVVELPGPEAIVVEDDGALLTGLLDGRIVRIRDHSEGRTPVVETVAHTGGRPLGMKRAKDGALIVADAHKGLLAIDEKGVVSVLASGHDGVPFVFADDLDIARDGTVYFSDASTRFSVEDWRMEVLEHRPTGRILAYHPTTKRTEVLRDHIPFANGVALADDEKSLVFTETTSYRVMRLWLVGPHRGEVELLAVLPGFPDNITWSSTRRVFWVAVGSPRKSIVDALAPFPMLRQVVSRLPAPLLPKPTKMAMAIAVDESGRIVHCLQDRSSTAYTPVASVIEHAGNLYLGSFASPGLSCVTAPPL